MRSIEERLTRDIAAITEGVVVTESDMLDAKSAVDERITDQSRRGRRRTAVALSAATAAAVAIVGVVAYQTLNEGTEASPAGPAPAISDPDAGFLKGAAPTPGLINGFWRMDNGLDSVMFHEDGTMQFDSTGKLVSDPAIAGTYSIDGGQITVVTTDGRPQCVGTEFAIRASFPTQGTMRVALAAAPDYACAPWTSARAVFQHVLPASQEMASFDNSKNPGWHPLRGDTALYGDFLAQGGGHVLEIAPDGSYYILGESAELADHGEWSLNGSDLTLNSSADSPQCSAGDRFVLSGLEEVNPGTLVFRGSVAQNACGGAWTPDEWIRVPSENAQGS